MFVNEDDLNAAIYAMTVIKDVVDARTRGTDIPPLHLEFNTVFGFLGDLDKQASYHD